MLTGIQTAARKSRDCSRAAARWAVAVIGAVDAVMLLFAVYTVLWMLGFVPTGSDGHVEWATPGVVTMAGVILIAGAVGAWRTGAAVRGRHPGSGRSLTYFLVWSWLLGMSVFVLGRNAWVVDP